MVSLIISIFAKFAYYEIFSKTFLVLLNSLIVYPIFFLANLIDKKISYVSSLLVTLLPISIINSRFVMTDHLGLLFSISAITLFFYALKNKKDILFYIGSFIFGLSILTKFTSLIVLILLVPFSIYLLKKPKAFTICATILLLTLAPFLVFSFQQFGNPLSVFNKAFHVVQSHDPINIGFFFSQFIDMFGILLSIFFLYGIYKLFKNNKIKNFINKNDKVNKINNFIHKSFLFQTLIVILYSFFILFRGVAKPPGMEWEVQRIILILIPYVIILSCYGIFRISESTKKNYTVPILVLSILLLISTNYSRIYSPAIEFEDGLRYVTKDMGVFIKNSKISEFSCFGNCPPIAYYSNKQMNHYYSDSSLIDSQPEYLVTFKEIEDYILMTKICHNSWCSYLYATK